MPSPAGRRKPSLKLEQLEERSLPSAARVVLPGHTDRASIVLRDGQVTVALTGGTKLFQAPQSTLALLSVQGSAGVNNLAVDLGALGNARHSFALKITGGSAIDHVWVSDPGQHDTVRLHPLGGSITGTGFSVDLDGGRSIQVSGGGGADSALISNTGGRGEVVMSEASVILFGKGDAVLDRVKGFATVFATGGRAGKDVALLDDRLGNDQVVLSPNTGSMRNDLANVHLRASGFWRVQALGRNSPGDQLYALTSSQGPTQLNFTPRAGTLTALRQYQDVFSGFPNVRVVDPGHHDVADLADGARNDVFIGNGPIASFNDHSHSWQLTLQGFSQVNVTGSPAHLNVLTVATPVSYGLSAAHFTPVTAWDLPQPPSTAQALALLKQAILNLDPALAHPRSWFDLVVGLRDFIHQRIVLGPNTPDWANQDPYTRFVEAVELQAEPVICGGISLLYLDALTAFGVTARRVGLFAANGVDTHASVEVWTGRQWIAMDATFNVSFTTRDGKRYLDYAQMQAGVPWLVQHNGTAARPNLILEKYYIPLGKLLYRLTYPPFA